jgi:hypothetical protein
MDRSESGGPLDLLRRRVASLKDQVRTARADGWSAERVEALLAAFRSHATRLAQARSVRGKGGDDA